MPYKNPEDKRRWEREHRERRNARRRQRQSEMHNPLANRPTPDPIPARQKTSGWGILGSIAVGAGLILLAGLAGASGINTGMGDTGK